MAGRLRASRTIVELAPAVAVPNQSIASRGSLAVPGPSGIWRGKSIRNWLSPIPSRGSLSSPGPAGDVLLVLVVVVVVVVGKGWSVGRHWSVPGVGALGVEVLEGRGGGEGGLREGVEGADVVEGPGREGVVEVAGEGGLHGGGSGVGRNDVGFGVILVGLPVVFPWVNFLVRWCGVSCRAFVRCRRWGPPAVDLGALPWGRDWSLGILVLVVANVSGVCVDDGWLTPSTAWVARGGVLG